MSGAVIDFTVAEQTDKDTPLIDRYDYISGAGDATYTLTVAAPQAGGRYVLAEHAGNFNSDITVTTVSGDEIGTLTVGDFCDYLAELIDEK